MPYVRLSTDAPTRARIYFGSRVTGFWRDPSCHFKTPTWNFYQEVYKQKWYWKGLPVPLLEESHKEYLQVSLQADSTMMRCHEQNASGTQKIKITARKGRWAISPNSRASHPLHFCWGRCRHCRGNYEARKASGGKYQARIGIFQILAAVNRFSRISRKVESCWGKLESHWGKQKTVDESRKPLTKIGFWARKIGFRARKISIFPKRFSSFWQFWDLFCYKICYHVCARIYLVELKYSQLK